MTLSWAAFLGAALLLAVTPGPGVVYVVGRTLAQGRAAGAASVAGVACGNVGNALVAALGLAVVRDASALAFDGLRLAGAAYLVWLGIASWRAPDAARATADFGPRARPLRLFADGALVALLNPKTALFFAAFLPQFIAAERPALAQAIGFGAAFVAVAAVTDLAYVALAAHVAARLGPARPAARWGRRAGGALLIGLGLATAVAGRAGRR